LRNSSPVLVLLYSSALFAQTVRVPFVGCESVGQAEAAPAPKGVDKVVHVSAGAATRLAYYTEGFRGTGVLAPRGWYCIGLYGSSGSELLIAPRSLKVAGLSGEMTGPVVKLEYISADNGSGRLDMAQVLARVFPAQSAFVKRAMDSLDQPPRWDPYPKDKLILQTDRLVQFQTPPHSEGLGTMSRLKANDDPIDGVALLQGQTPDLLMLRVRLPLKQRDLAPVIIQQLLLRQRSDSR
jgi:hypothetical protein